jgi:uncharacterized NAD(P)/FAD-binding protein YdhS
MIHVIVIGGGASGALAAAQILQHGGSVTLLEPAAEVGRGLAYSTPCPRHLLNVAAYNMSALAYDAGHFLRWLERTRPGAYGECSFVPRRIYGEYVQSVLEEARLASSGQFRHARSQAISMAADGARLSVSTNTETLYGDAVVLATGIGVAQWPNLDPEVAANGQFFHSAWDEGAFAADQQGDPVLLLGSGLTAVDGLMALRRNGHRGIVYMVSRRGLLPQAHVLPVPCGVQYRRDLGARALVREMRAAARRAPGPAAWREVVDSLRASTNAYWQAWSEADQRRFLRHLRPFWDTHRHRMAPEIGNAVDVALDDGSLRLIAGRIRGLRICGRCLEAAIAMRATAEIHTLHVGRAINCTGVGTNVAQTENPILQNLMAQGWMQPDAHRMGALVDEHGALVPKCGGTRPVYTIGPLRLGTLIESVAIPEIRVQACEVAELLTDPPN